MALNNVHLTQSNLQDYLTCPCRFQLRHLRHVNWPAVQTTPVQEAERRMQLGSDFHRLIQQHLLGLPQAELTAFAAQQPDLSQMWHNYLTHRPPELNQPNLTVYPEVTLATILNNQRLLAKYDLVALLPNNPPHILIVDWKTTRHRPKSATLQGRVQTRLYPFILALAGQSLLHTPITPQQITMQYWFANHPAEPEIIQYSEAQFAADRAYLSDLLAEIEAATTFPLTEDKRACRFCVYRSYCDRGDVAGHVDEYDDDFMLEELSLDWEQIAEIAY